MIAYFDASALAKRYVQEPGSEVVESWLRDVIPATSRWTQVEVLSAVSRRCREGCLTLAQRGEIATGLAEDLAAFVVVELTPEAIALADGLLIRHPLRAGDAVHLASALLLAFRTAQPVRFHAFDTRLSVAAEREGLVVEFS